jgi:hypothetical protein
LTNHFSEATAATAILGVGIRPVLVSLMIICLLACAAGGQSLEEYQFKAASLFNIAKFVYWPSGAFKSANDPIVCCVVGEGPFGRALEQQAGSKVIDQRKFVIQHVYEARQVAGCHILFVSSLERKRWRSLTNVVRGRGILTVGETEDFISDGGIVNFKVEGDKVRIEINVDHAERDKIQISSKLLSLSQIVTHPK